MGHDEVDGPPPENQPWVPADAVGSSAPEAERATPSGWDRFGDLYAAPAPVGRDGFSVAALVLGILPILGGILGIVFGIVALRRIGRSAQAGRSFAIAGIVLGSIWIVALLGIAVVENARSADRDSSGTLASAGLVSSTDLRLGDCLSRVPVGERLRSVEVVPCPQPHLGEVYEIYDLPGGPYQGTAQVVRLAEGRCAATIDAFVGVPEGEADYAIAFLYPQLVSWEAGDHGVACIISDPAGEPLRGSARSSGRRVASSPEPRPAPPGQASGPVSVSDLRIGDCTKGQADERSGTIDLVPCARPHAAEVFTTFSLPAGAYPGDAEVDRLVLGRCRADLPKYVVRTSGRTGYSLNYFMPDRALWVAGDREAVCLLEDPKQRLLTGSAKGKGRNPLP